MSRHVDVLPQIESAFGVSRSRLPGEVERGAIPGAPLQRANSIDEEETLRMVRRVFLPMNEVAPRHVVFCGVDSQNGSSSVCGNAGRALTAAISGSVCLVDGNLNAPRLAGLFGVESTLRVRDCAAPLRDRCLRVDQRLWLAQPGLLADEFGKLQSVAELRRALAELCDAFDYVLIDAPATTISVDASILGQAADGTILVIEADRTRRLTARKAVESLVGSGVPLLGTVLHNRSFPIPEAIYQRL